MELPSKSRVSNDDNKEIMTNKQEENNSDSDKDLNHTYLPFLRENNMRRSER